MCVYYIQYRKINKMWCCISRQIMLLSLYQESVSRETQEETRKSIWSFQDYVSCGSNGRNGNGRSNFNVIGHVVINFHFDHF